MTLSEWHQTQKRFFDDTAHEYGANFEQDNPYFRFVIDHYVDAIRCEAGEKILEIGASGGRFTVPLLDRGCKVTGVDLSAKSFEHLERQVASHPHRGNLRLIEDDASSFSRLEDRDFDAVVGAHILHHVEDIRKVLAQALGRLRPGGRAVFLEPNPWNPQWYVHMTIHPRKSWRVEKGFLRMWPGAVRRMFLESGFSECRVCAFGCFPPFILNNIPGSRALERLIERCGPVSRLLTLNIFSARKA